MNSVSEIAKKLLAKGRNLADRRVDTVHYPVDMFIGTDNYNDFVFPEKQEEGVAIINSILGDQLSGTIREVQCET